MIVKNVRKLGKYISKLFVKMKSTNGNTKNISKNKSIFKSINDFSYLFYINFINIE